MQKLETLRARYNHFASINGFNNFNPKELYQPLDYILALGGKQMRPLLLLMSAEFFDKNAVENVLPAAYAIELFHNFSLIHDDIMDEADIRRGQPTVHQKFGPNTAILSGDVMLVYAYQYLLKINSNRFKEIVQVFNETAIGVCEGQQMDMNFEKRVSVPIEDYIRMIELKTSVLLHGAMKIGALCTDANDSDANNMAEFGRNMGIAFQLQDDYLDSFGDEAVFGKKIGGDILQNKKTYLFLKALELADSKQKDELLHFYSANSNNSDETAKINNVKTIFTETGAITELKKEISHYREKALDCLGKISINSQGKEDLSNFLHFIMNREN
jgi:geranylgeranyl diphosphate synthase type II